MDSSVNIILRRKRGILILRLLNFFTLLLDTTMSMGGTWLGFGFQNGIEEGRKIFLYSVDS